MKEDYGELPQSDCNIYQNWTYYAVHFKKKQIECYSIIVNLILKQKKNENTEKKKKIAKDWKKGKK